MGCISKKVTALLLSVFFLGSPLIACTGVRLTAADGSVVTGRTLEFGVDIDLYAAVIPRNYLFIGKTSSGQGLSYTSKFAAVGMYCFNEPVLMDGINEKGLVAAAFYFPGFAKYAELTKDTQPKALSPVEFPHWILTQFETIEEVRDALSSIVIVPTVTAGWGNSAPPLHYIVYDKTGKSIVIEPINGSLTVYENPLGVVTNSPRFDWHLTNLRNFINLSVFNVDAKQVGSLKLAPFGQGSGMVGLPGDFTPPSRFVRAAIFSVNAVQSKTSEDAALQTFHLLNQFDIPKGTVREKTETGTFMDYTMMTSVKDAKTLRYYYKSYEDQSLKFIDLNAFDLNAKTIKKYQVKGRSEFIDASALLH